MTQPDKVPMPVVEGVASLVRETAACPACNGASRAYCDRCEGEGRVDKPAVRQFEKLLQELRWAGDHYCIPNWHGMYIGIEVDGYVHS